MSLDIQILVVDVIGQCQDGIGSLTENINSHLLEVNVV